MTSSAAAVMAANQGQRFRTGPGAPATGKVVDEAVLFEGGGLSVVDGEMFDDGAGASVADSRVSVADGGT